MSFVAPSVPVGTAVTSYHWEISTDGTNAATDTYHSVDYVGLYGNTTATSSPQTDPDASVCGDGEPCFYRMRAVDRKSTPVNSSHQRISDAVISLHDELSVVPVAAGVAFFF